MERGTASCSSTFHVPRSALFLRDLLADPQVVRIQQPVDLPPHAARLVAQALERPLRDAQPVGQLADRLRELIARRVPLLQLGQLLVRQALAPVRLLARDERVGRERVLLVLNRADSRVGISDDDVQRIVSREPEIRVPSDIEVTRSVNEGRPIVLSRP